MTRTHIIIHHSATVDSKTFSWGAIRTFHIEVNKWQDIGYHFGVELVGEYYEIMIGRSWYAKGAHCPEENMNSLSLGICIVGDFDKEEPPSPQLLKAAHLVQDLRTMFNIPLENVKGHRDYNPHKSCPGSKFDMDFFRELVRL
jgi:N-acetyl-anhydromuramyl-L-alanine amidase AmpD